MVFMLKQVHDGGSQPHVSGHVVDVACAGSLRYIICIVNCEPSDQQPGSSVGRATCPQGYDPGSSPSGLKMCIADEG